MNRRELIKLAGKVGVLGLVNMGLGRFAESIGMFTDLPAEAATLPQNYQVTAGTLLCDSNLAALTNNSKSSGDATIVVSDNTDPAFIRPSGVGTSIKLDVTAAGTGFTIWNLDWTINTSLVNIGRFGFAYYFSPSVLTNWGLTVMLSEASNFANRYNYSPFTVAPNAARQGWNTVVLDRATPSSTTGSPNIANTFTRVRVQLQVPAGVTGTVYLCPIYTNMYHRPKIVFSYDDQDSSQYEHGYQVLDTYGLPGSQCVQTSFTGGLSVAQFNEMKADGWSFHNHSQVHTNLTTVSVAAAKEEMRLAQAWLDDRGFTHGRSTVVFPNGATNDAIDAAMAELGYTHGAIVRKQLDKLWDGFEQPRRINRWNTDQSSSLATLKGVVDDAIKFGSSIVFYSHAILDGATGSNTERVTYLGLVQYVARLAAGNVLDVVTLQGLIDGLTNPRRKRST